MKQHTSSEKKHGRVRLAIQLAAAVLANGYAAGFAKGAIFQGRSKLLCVPVLNCYSCPGALGACPIGALQAVLGSRRYNLSFYVLGTLMLFGVVLGRLVCGFLCPFGLVQDLLHHIPVPKLRVPRRVDKPLRWLKYVVLAVLVLLLPIFFVNEYGLAPPYFCAWLCPAGTLEGALPLLAKNESLRAMAGALFSWKACMLGVVLILSTLIERPFCKYLCPLGAFYGLFSRFGFYQLHLHQARCIGCGKCEQVCPMQVEVRRNANSAECIRCGKCKAACPTGALTSSFGGVGSRQNAEPSEKSTL